MLKIKESAVHGKSWAALVISNTAKNRQGLKKHSELSDYPTLLIGDTLGHKGAPKAPPPPRFKNPSLVITPGQGFAQTPGQSFAQTPSL